MRNMNKSQKDISRVLDAVAEGYATSIEISGRIGLPLPAVSSYLSELKKCHLIEVVGTINLNGRGRRSDVVMPVSHA